MNMRGFIAATASVARGDVDRPRAGLDRERGNRFRADRAWGAAWGDPMPARWPGTRHAAGHLNHYQCVTALAPDLTRRRLHVPNRKPSY